MRKLDDFWDNNAYSVENYVEDYPTEDIIDAIEKELGYKLPTAYVETMRVQNGGTPRFVCFPTTESTSWAEDHIEITGVFGIGWSKIYSLGGELGSKFMKEEWGYPDFGICICDCPSAGHDMVMLDYRKNGPKGEPQVVHVDQGDDYQITFLAENFEMFIDGLVLDEKYL